MPSCSNPSNGARGCRAPSSGRSTSSSATSWPGCRCDGGGGSRLISGMNASRGYCVQGKDFLDEDGDDALRSCVAAPLDRLRGAGRAARRASAVALALLALLMAAAHIRRDQSARQGRERRKGKKMYYLRRGTAQQG